MNVLIAIPAFNEEATIVEVLRGLPRQLPGVDEIQRLVVDDGSTDRTASLARDEDALVICHAQNRGVGAAFQTVVEHSLRSRADVLVTLDADGQFDSAQIQQLIKPLIDGQADLVTGSRFHARRRPPRMPRLKYWGNLWIARLIRFFSGVKLEDVSCGFRAYGREALLHLNLFGRFTYTQETILDMAFKGSRIVEVPIDVRYFEERRSRVATSIPRYALNSIKIITRTVRDFKPLRFFGTLGFGVFFIGGVLDLWLFRHFLLTGSFSPYKAVGFVGGALNICGILLAGLGLLADMLGRIRANQERILYYHKRHAFDEPEIERR